MVGWLGGWLGGWEGGWLGGWVGGWVVGGGVVCVVCVVVVGGSCGGWVDAGDGVRDGTTSVKHTRMIVTCNINEN